MSNLKHYHIFSLIYLFSCFMFVCILNKSPIIVQQKAKNVLIYESSTTEMKAPKIVEYVVDQIKNNNQNYSNNVWTTLATVMLAIGVILSSNSFQVIFKNNLKAAIYFQILIFLIFLFHAFAYYHYYISSYKLMLILKSIVGDITYYQSYNIQKYQVYINFAFDTALFLILSFIVDKVSGSKE